MNLHFPEIKKNFGFGMMRLPMIGEEVDMETTCKMVDAFLAAGFNYFDTAHPYIQGKSEEAVKQCLADRYPRDAFILADKLSGGFEKEEEIRPLIDLMLQKCGVEYFDFFLMHAMSATRFEKYRDAHAYEIALEAKAAGKLHHVGMSFHDSAEVLDRILTAWPEIEFVQLQFNYLDYEDPKVQSRLCYEVCRKHGKPVMVMEPVRGGALVNLPQEALELLPDGSPASYALRFAAGFPLIAMVLSGMSDEAQMADNLATMGQFKPLTEAQQQTLVKVRTMYQAQHKVPCTGCAYCVEGCPAGIPIPDVFSLLNKKLAKEEFDETAYGAFDIKADACVGCGACEKACPQKLEIRQLLVDAHKTLA